MNRRRLFVLMRLNAPVANLSIVRNLFETLFVNSSVAIPVAHDHCVRIQVTRGGGVLKLVLEFCLT